MNITLIISIILVLLVFVGGLLIVFRQRKPKLSPDMYKKSIQGIEKTATFSPPHGVMDSHKFFIKALNSLVNKRMSAAEVTTYLAKYIPNEKEVWSNHRLRNRVAHETDIRVSKYQAENARNAFIRALDAFK